MTYDTLKFFISNLKPKLHLELGVYDGSSIKVVQPYCKSIHAVDINVDCGKHIAQYQNVSFFNLDTDEFFCQNNNDELYETVFIDACHNYEFLLRDFNNSFNRLVTGGYIFIHDTFPLSEYYHAQHLCGDSYLFLANNRLSNKYECLTMPFHPGLTIVRKL